MHGSDKFIVLLLKKSIAIMIKGKIRNKRVRKSFLEGKKKNWFFLEGKYIAILFGRRKGAGFLCSSRQSPEQPLKKAPSFLAARRWNEHKRRQKVCIVEQTTWNEASWWKECSIHTQTRICIQPGRGREIPKPSWGKTEKKALTAAFAGIQQKEERKKFSKKGKSAGYFRKRGGM